MLGSLINANTCKYNTRHNKNSASLTLQESKLLWFSKIHAWKLTNYTGTVHVHPSKEKPRPVATKPVVFNLKNNWRSSPQNNPMNWKINWPPLLPLSEPQWIFPYKDGRIGSSSTLSRSNATIQIIVVCWHHHIHRSPLVSWDQHRQNRKWQDTMWRFAVVLIAYAWNWNKFKLLCLYCTFENRSKIEHVNLFTSKMVNTIKHYMAHFVAPKVKHRPCIVENTRWRLFSEVSNSRSGPDFSRHAP